LDVLVRDDLLKFLKADSEERGATILCTSLSRIAGNPLSSIVLDATHIFDGLNDFPTHIAHMRLGTLVTVISWPLSKSSLLSSYSHPSTPLYKMALDWLKEDREHRRALEKCGISRGARRNEVTTPVPLPHQV
jgi:CCR4-NOT complex subunit CAF16